MTEKDKLEHIRKVTEMVGYIKGKIETMNTCLTDIRSQTEHDIWYPAWEQTRQGLGDMQRLIDKGYIR